MQRRPLKILFRRRTYFLVLIAIESFDGMKLTTQLRPYLQHGSFVLVLPHVIRSRENRAQALVREKFVTMVDAGVRADDKLKVMLAVEHFYLLAGHG